jgi:hypothetical protein
VLEIVLGIVLGIVLEIVLGIVLGIVLEIVLGIVLEIVLEIVLGQKSLLSPKICNKQISGLRPDG